MYYIANREKTKFITIDKNKNYIFCSSFNTAEQFDNKNKAESILKNNIPTSLKQITTELIIYEIDEQIPQLEYIEQNSEIELSDCENRPLTYDVRKLIEQILLTQEEIFNEKKRLNNLLTHIHRAIVDLNHYKENVTNRLSSADAKITRFDTQLLRKRREIKQQLEAIELFEYLTCNPTDKKSRIEKFRCVDYNPREFKDLFETKELPDFKEWWNELNKVEKSIDID